MEKMQSLEEYEKNPIVGYEICVHPDYVEVEKQLGFEPHLWEKTTYKDGSVRWSIYVGGVITDFQLGLQIKP